MSKLQNWTWVPLAIAMTITLAAIGYTLNEGEHQSASDLGLPNVRYRIHFLQLPTNAEPGHTSINDISNAGEVVGLYTSGRGISAFLYAPTRDAARTIDLNELAVGGIPEGAWLRAGIAINEWGVVVGSLQLADGDIHPFALDLGVETPVVDLLPHCGARQAYAVQINEHGDIVVQIDDPPSAYVLNPGLYNGDPAVRASRNGVPQDLSKQTPQLLPADISSGPLQLNNPHGDRPAQIAGVTNDHVAFRYTTGKTPTLETFPTLQISKARSHVEGLNDAGMFCGQYFNTAIDDSYERRLFRYDRSLELLPGTVSDPISDFNSSGDLITREYFYRDDWGFVHVTDLVVGSDADVATWKSGIPFLYAMSDRENQTDAPTLVGELEGVTIEDETSMPRLLFVLTPELLPEQ